MHLAAPAILIAARPHGETAVIARMLTEAHGVVAAYVAGGRGRQLRPVVIPGNTVQAEIRAKSDSQLAFARLELERSRAPWLTEPLPAAAIGWACALTATALPERNPYPSVHAALGGLLDAICAAPSARLWADALVAYEALLLRELGYGGGRPKAGGIDQALAALDRMEQPIADYLLPDRRRDVLQARTRLRALLGRMAA